MNELTKKLYAEGYTQDDHPPYVKWDSGWREFEYTLDAVKQMIWETPCGLLRQGRTQDGCGNGSFMGITYCPENGNLRIGCPYYYKDRNGEYIDRECIHRDIKSPIGWNCTTHPAQRAYDYGQSVEKIMDKWDEIKHIAWLEVSRGYGYCVCMEFNRTKRKYVPNYNVMQCISVNCKNEICAVTHRPRNLERVNIFYDIIRERHYKKGLFEFTDKTIEKGVKQFEHPVARTDAEIWLKEHGKNLVPHYSMSDYSDMHFSKYHHGKYGDYEWSEYTITPVNIRIEKRESRDLLQDLRDAAEGIEIYHASDLQKQKKEAYRERKAKRKEAKERKIIKNLKRVVIDGVNSEGEPITDHDYMKEWALKELKRRGIIQEKAIKQQSIF